MQFGYFALIFALCLQWWGTGQIWFCQRMTYPLFAKVGVADYIAFHQFYGNRIPLPTIIPGFLSFIMPLVLLFAAPATVPQWMLWGNASCGVIAFIVTVGFEIPRHVQLQRHGKNDTLIDELIRYNWPRTAAMTLSACLTLAMCTWAFAPA